MTIVSILVNIPSTRTCPVFGKKYEGGLRFIWKRMHGDLEAFASYAVEFFQLHKGAMRTHFFC